MHCYFPKDTICAGWTGPRNTHICCSGSKACQIDACSRDSPGEFYFCQQLLFHQSVMSPPGSESVCTQQRNACWGQALLWDSWDKDAWEIQTRWSQFLLLLRLPWKYRQLLLFSYWMTHLYWSKGWEKSCQYATKLGEARLPGKVWVVRAVKNSKMNYNQLHSSANSLVEELQLSGP